MPRERKNVRSQQNFEEREEPSVTPDRENPVLFIDKKFRRLVRGPVRYGER